jgi:hypothetical protein
VRGRLDERVLQQVLGRVLITGQHVGQPDQPRRPARDELREFLPGAFVHWPSTS